MAKKPTSKTAPVPPKAPAAVYSPPMAAPGFPSKPTPKQEAIAQMQMRRESAQYRDRAAGAPLQRERLSSGDLSDDPTESGEPVRNPKPIGKIISEG